MASTQRSRVARQRTRQLDEVLQGSEMPTRPAGGWLVAIREALGMSKTQLAKRMGITRPSLDKLESNEREDKITLASLRRAADALGCDLQYVLIPRKSLGDFVAERANYVASKKLGRINQSQALEASSMDADAFSESVKDLAREIEMTRPADLWND